MITNPFIMPLDHYGRDLDVVANFNRTSAKIVSLQQNVPYEEAFAFVSAQTKEGGQFAPKDRPMQAIRRKKGEDRYETVVGFQKYLKWVGDKSQIMAPNMVAYCQPKEEVSQQVAYIIQLQELRKTQKSMQMEAKLAGDHFAVSQYFNLQNRTKFLLNSISGATSVGGNCFYFASMHTTLTSLCRAETSYSNAILEKLLASQRHYHKPEILLANIGYIVNTADIPLIRQVMVEYELSYPTVDYAIELVHKSTDQYWSSEDMDETLRNIFTNMDRAELAAFVFCNDIQALTEFNGPAMRKIFDGLMLITDEEHPDPDVIINNLTSDMEALVSVLCIDFMEGVKLSDLKELNPRNYAIYASRAVYIAARFMELAPFIRAFICTDMMPPEIHSFPNATRSSVVASDTDSSIFTMFRQIAWYCGSVNISDHNIRFAAIMTFFASQTVAHSLIQLCAQMGMEDKAKTYLTMKNEFFFPIMGITTNTKHYLGMATIQEGNILKEPEIEVKGVGLKSSKLPRYLRSKMDEFYEVMMSRAAEGNPLTRHESIAVPAYIEYIIDDAIEAGSLEFFKTEKVKPPAEYAAGEDSPGFKAFKLWQDFFGPTYGYVDMLPTTFISIKVNLKNKSALREWADTLPLPMKQYIEDRMEKGLKNITRFFVPPSVVKGGKIPKEIMGIINSRGLKAEMTSALDMANKVNGVYVGNSQNTRSSSDLISREDAKKLLCIDV